MSDARPAPHLSIRGLRSAFCGPIDLDLARGECVPILGRSGSGKSAFLRLVADLDPADGEVRLDGRNRTDGSGPEWRRQVVYQAAEPAWWAPDAAAHFLHTDPSLLRELLPALGLPLELLRLDVGRLSTGERQRLALVRSLARAPSVLLLDEPSASLDPDSTLAMEALLREQLRAGMAILMVTHSPEQARRMLGDAAPASRRMFEMTEGLLRRL